MTLVSVRLDSSFGIHRITALADSRASIGREDGTFKTVNDTTTKLFALPIRCFRLDGLTPGIGSWDDPYYETQVGLGFSGSCFECLSLVAHISRAFGALIAPQGDEPRPEAGGLMNLAGTLITDYFDKHSGDGKPVALFLLFGFDDGRPWVAKLTWRAATGLRQELIWADENTLMTIGRDTLFEQYASKLRSKVNKHRDDVRAKSANAQDRDIHELRVAQHDVADKKLVEEGMLRDIENEYFGSIGGVLQRLELSCQDGNVSAGYTRDDQPYIDGSQWSVTTRGALAPIPIVEKMGRQIRPWPAKDEDDKMPGAGISAP
ncbi:hypothetical protein [Mangrovicella endophytica]|uniref:hypothetical protein n=1 Tax=Mangrovicella endophytica TaxID=2066697 RepID=UPI0013000551|nr:hypothetical protein [Mangrovicella endophytica]